MSVISLPIYLIFPLQRPIIIYGEDASEDDAEAVEKALYEKYGNDVEISIVNGGQPIYYFIISVE